MNRAEEKLELVRHFAENSVKFLLRDKDNAREALTMMAPDQARLIDFERMTVVQGTFVAPDFRHLETDLLLKAPMLGFEEGSVYVYQLIEHQSEPDELAVYRAIRYQMQVFDLQVRQWLAKHKTLRGIQFDPVLPVIVYTGTRTWEKLTPMRELVKQGQRFVGQTPALEPVFFNLAKAPVEKLHAEAGLFGRVLHLMQQRGAKPIEFQTLLTEVVGHVDQLPEGERVRWHDLLWYLQAMVYHVREKPEHGPLVGFIRDTARSKARQEEVIEMGQTMAEYLEEKGMSRGLVKGKQEGKQEMLLAQLREKYKLVPAKIEAIVQTTNDEAKLEAWGKELLWADNVTDISFEAGS